MGRQKNVNQKLYTRTQSFCTYYGMMKCKNKKKDPDKWNGTLFSETVKCFGNLHSLQSLSVPLFTEKKNTEENYSLFVLCFYKCKTKKKKDF